MPVAIPVNPADVKLSRDPKSLLWLENPDGDVSYSLRAAFVPHEDIWPAGVRGHKFVESEAKMITFPCKLKRSSDQVDLIVLCLKHRGDADYYLGAPADKVQAFDPEKVDAAKWDYEQFFIPVKR